MWLVKQIARSFQDHCNHDSELILFDIRKGHPLEKHSEWKVQWCRSCGAYRHSKTEYLVGSSMITTTEWTRPEANKEIYG